MRSYILSSLGALGVYPAGSRLRVYGGSENHRLSNSGAKV
jgi:hypothetical protein